MNNALVLGQILFLGAAMLVALFYFGYGATRVLLPASLRAWRVYLSPFTGMALVIVWDYLALFFGFDLTLATWALAATATLLNLYALAGGWREIRESYPPRAALARLLTPFVPREQCVLFGLAFVAFAAAAAPLVRYGYVTIIGENWDYEFYLPLADLLRHMPTAALANAPANPLLVTILSGHILPLPMGFSYLQATLDVLTGVAALDSFAILLALLHALGVGAAFVFLRTTFKMSSRAALVAAGLLAINGLLLWFTYWNFGLHLASLALLPIALLFGTYALREPLATNGDRARALVPAGLFLAALNVTFHPALVAALLPLAAVGLYQLVAVRNRAETCMRGAVIVGLTLAFSFPTLLHIDDFLREYYRRAPLAIGLRDFVPLSDGYGLSLYLLNLAVGHSIPTPWLYALGAQSWDLFSPLFLAGAILLSVYALWKLRTDPERRAVWYLIVGASVFYVALFRLPFLRPYPYGFLKSLSLVSYILLAIAVQGGAYLFQLTATGFSPLHPRARRVGRVALGIAACGFLVLVLATFALSFEQYFKPQPRFFNVDDLKLREIADLIPPGARVLLTDRAEQQQIPMGLAAYALLSRELRGNVTTGYAALNNVEPGVVYEYALLARGEDASARGYAAQPVWSNDRFALYRRAPGVDYQRALDAQTIAPQALTFTLGANQIVAGTQTLSAPPATRTVQIPLASFVPQTVDVQLGEQVERVNLERGLSLYTAPVTLPTTLTLTPTVASELLRAADATVPHQLPETDPTLFVPYMQLGENVMKGAALESSDALLVRCTNLTAGDLDERCFVVNPKRVNLTWRWIVRGMLQGSHADQVLARVEAVGAPRERIDIGAQPSGLVNLQFDDTPSQSFKTPALPDGAFRGALEILADDVLLARIDLYNFTITKNGNSLTRDSHVSPLVIVRQ